MKSILASVTLLLVAAPAQAQLLGGGGLGGGLGGTLGGTGSINLPTRSIETVTRSAGSVTGSTEGSQSVDRKSGRVTANRKASARGAGSLDQAVSTPLGGFAGSGSGSAQGSGEASGNAQLVGTDAVRGIAGSTVGQARGAATTLGGIAASTAGSVSGAASGSASGMFSGAAGQLAAAGSAAGQAAGTFDIAPGMAVSDPKGDQIATVRQVIADSRGRIQELVVMTDDGPATVPAANFTGSGSLLISAMGEGRLEKKARQQEEAAE